MALALFDLDNTLLAGDSDALWGEFLVEQGMVDATYYSRENQRFYDLYKQGKLDIYEFAAFAFKPLAENDMDTLLHLREQFVREKIRPIMTEDSINLVETHRYGGDTLVIITATNSFVTSPIAAEYGVENLVATEPEIIDGKFTGKIAGTPCFQDGKVTRLQEWLNQNPVDLTHSCFYGDSMNDLPLLEKVDQPCAVDPDDTLRASALERGWPIISLRGQTS